MHSNRIPLERILLARERIRKSILRTPLVRLPTEGLGVHPDLEVWLKLENLQPMGSFKLRGASNAMAAAPEGELGAGVFTASAGNMAQGVAWNARRLGIDCGVLVPEGAPKTKLNSLERLGAKLKKVSFDDWWQVMLSGQSDAFPGHFIHPVLHPEVMAGHGTIGLELLEDLPQLAGVIVPYGGGGLATGIASAVLAERPDARILAAEVETAAPLAAAFANGTPTAIKYKSSFVDGIGGRGLLPGMWARIQGLLAGSRVVSLENVAEAIRVLVERCQVVAEGAGAAPVAAALGSKDLRGQWVCVVSGGNIDPEVLASILNGQTPGA